MSAPASPPLAASNYQIFRLPDFTLKCGVVVPELQLAYKTYGNLNRDRSNVVLYPTSYGAQHMDIEWLIGGPDSILDSTRYFIVIPNMLGNGLSTSPSNSPFPPGHPFPFISHVDNVIAQRRMLAEVFGITRLAMAYGWSMGAQQALHWGALFPDSVERIAAVCTSARTSPHNQVFLEGLRATLTTDPNFVEGYFRTHPEKGLRAFGRVYAGWALSQAFYREHVYLSLGYTSLEDFLVRDWEASFLRRDANNLLSMLQTWLHSDISDNDVFQGDLDKALASITAKTFIIPGQTDLYFTPEDSLIEARKMPNAEFRPIPSIWGHRAGNPSKHLQDQLFLKAAVADLLNDS
ncbi:alpha/beta fold hydrolase [Schlesneria sp. T3-172]|uniref:alpha/beta fold hydrolase n=1 Tax=Schlesneria sphaerica TaxID=3373610 RepID=UPI0037CB6317